MGYFISVCWMILLQTQTTTSSAAEAAGAVADGAGAAEGAPGGFFQDFQYMLPIMAAIMALYLILLRPQQSDKDKATGNVKNLKKNDRVLTVGGIVGTVISSPEQSEFTTIRIDESNNTKIQVRTVSIARVMTDDEQKSGTSGAKK
jgi:preprotein translocase subunit YajC